MVQLVKLNIKNGAIGQINKLVKLKLLIWWNENLIWSIIQKMAKNRGNGQRLIDQRLIWSFALWSFENTPIQTTKAFLDLVSKMHFNLNNLIIIVKKPKCHGVTFRF